MLTIAGCYYNLPKIKIYFYSAKFICRFVDNRRELGYNYIIKNNYDIVRIYRSNSKEKHDYTDVYELYRHIYDINWYPSFIILEDGTYRFIGEVPLNELADLILSH